MRTLGSREADTLLPPSAFLRACFREVVLSPLIGARDFGRCGSTEREPCPCRKPFLARIRLSLSPHVINPCLSPYSCPRPYPSTAHLCLARCSLAPGEDCTRLCLCLSANRALLSGSSPTPWARPSQVAHATTRRTRRRTPRARSTGGTPVVSRTRFLSSRTVELMHCRTPGQGAAVAAPAAAAVSGGAAEAADTGES